VRAGNIYTPTASNAYAGIAFKSTGGVASYGLDHDGGGVTPNFSASPNAATTSGGDTALSSGVTDDWGNWNHIVGVFNGSTMVIYTNGVQTASTSATSALTALTGYPLWIGNIQYYTAGQWNGLVAEVAVYSTALTAARVLAHYNAAGYLVNTASQTVTGQSVQRAAGR
jgi:hypothetical protein